MFSARPTRLISSGILAAVVAAFVAISPAAADTIVKQHGKVGVGSLNEAPGDVVCLYDSVAQALQSVEIAGPNIFARDTTPAQETQWIGWQLIVKRTGGGLPTLVQKSVVQKAVATDDTSATFNPFTYELDSQPPPDVIYSFSVKLYWFKPNGRTVAGWAKHRVDNYTWETPTFVGDYPGPACQGQWGVPTP
jgi:hypothetical protein